MSKKKEPPHCKTIRVTLSKPLIEAIDKKAGVRGRSKFIRDAAAEKLNRPYLAKTRLQGRPKTD